MSELEFEILFEELDNKTRIVIIDIKGSLQKFTIKKVTSKINDLMQEKVQYYIFKLNQLRMIDKQGIEFLVEIFDNGEENGAQFFLTYVHPKVETILRSLGVDSLFEIMDDEKLAIQKIGRDIGVSVTKELKIPKQKGKEIIVVLTEKDKVFMSNLEKIIKRGGLELPILPDMALKLMELTSSPRSTVDDVENLIGRDQSVAAQLLKISNSVMYGARFEITSLKNAIVRLGIRKVRSVVFAISMKAIILKGKNIDIIARNLWRHSIACAILSEHIAKKIVKWEGDIGELFTAGLLHDIYKVVILSSCRDAIKQIEDYFPRAKVLELVYKKYFKRIFVLIANKWKLPSVITDMILDMKEEPQEDINDIAILDIANKILKVLDKRIKSFDDIDDELSLLELSEEDTLDLIEFAKKINSDVAKVGRAMFP